MITPERLCDYLHALEPSQGSLLDAIEEEARAQGVPIVRSETAAFLRTMLAALRPQALLEVGTAVGYSTLVMCRAMPQASHITTIEKYGKRIPQAQENFRRAGEQQRITLLEGDAGIWLERLAAEGRRFDFIFMDAAKGQYLTWLPSVLALLPEGGVLISDNVLQDGEVAESRFAVRRRDRTIHSRMRGYLWELKHSRLLETAILPLGDGVAISTRKGSLDEKDGTADPGGQP